MYRAIETAEIVAKILGISDVVQSPQMGEFTFFEESTKEQLRAAIRQALLDPERVTQRGVTLVQMQDEFLTPVMREAQRGFSHFLGVSHGLAIRSTCYRFDSALRPPAENILTSIQEASFSVLSIKGSNISVARFNEHGFMPKELINGR